MLPEIMLTQAQAVEACKMFMLGIESDFAADRETGMVPFNSASEVLRKAFETVAFVAEHALADDE